MSVQEALVDRGEELAALDSALARARGGDGGVVFVDGPAGIGKTSVLAAAAQRAAEQEMDILRASGAALEREMAFGVVRQLLERRVTLAPDAERERLLNGAAALAGPLLGLSLRPPDAAPGIDPAHSYLHGLYWVVANIASEHPTAIVVDDIHWADRVSLMFLCYLARRLEGVPALLLVASRSDEPGSDDDLLAELRGQPEALRMPLAPLSADGVGRLVADTLGTGEDRGLIDACHSASGGNPFLLRELLAEIRRRDPERAPGEPVAVEALGPATVAHSILLRIGRLGAPALQLAAALAVLGDGVELRLAGALAGLGEGEARPAADDLVAAGVLDQSRPLRFAHPIVRTAILEDLPPGERAKAHRQAADLLVREGEAGERVVAHLLRTDPAGDPNTVTTLLQAAKTALGRGAADVAATLLDRALLEPPTAQRRPEVLAALGESRLRLGDWGPSSQYLAEAIDLEPDPERRVGYALARAHAVLAADGADATVATLERALRDAGEGELALLVQAELCGQAVLSAPGTHPALAEIARHADAAGETRAERRLLAVLSLQAVCQPGPATAAADLARRALHGGRLLEEESAASIFYFLPLSTLLFAEEDADIETAIDWGLTDVRRRGAIWALPGIACVRAMLALRQGDLRAAEEAARQCVEHALPTMAGSAASILAEVLLERGDPEAAGRELVAAGVEGPGARWRNSYWFGPFGRGRVRLALGRAAEALSDFEAVRERVEAVGGVPAGLAWRPHRALALGASGETDAAVAAADAAVAHARDWGTPWLTGLALRTRARVGAGEERIGWLMDAIEVLEPSSARLEFAKASHDLGVALARSGERTEARDQLRTAVEVARQVGARGLAEAAHEELRIAGARPRKLMFSGVDSLTASERRVSEMAARGMTNRAIAEDLFVTVKTVENHLGRAYRKLGVDSRAKLPGVLEAFAAR